MHKRKKDLFIRLNSKYIYFCMSYSFNNSRSKIEYECFN